MKGLVLSISAGTFLLLLVGCGDGPHSRLNALLDAQIYRELQVHSTWPKIERIGLMVHSDATGPGAAQPISSEFLGILSRRTEQFLLQRCQVASVISLPFPSLAQRVEIQQALASRGEEHRLSHMLLVLLSSREQTGPVTLGQERMMTQMSGTMVENTALAEVIVLRLSDFQGLIVLPASSTETLEFLDAPLGEGGPSLEESFEILRAQAAQQALDRSLHVFGQWCKGIPEEDWT